MSLGPKILWNMSFQVFFHRIRSFPIAQAKPVGKAEDVGVHSDDRLVVDYGGDDIGSLSTHSAQLHQLFYFGRDFSLVSADYGPGHLDQVQGFRVRVRDGGDDLFYRLRL